MTDFWIPEDQILSQNVLCSQRVEYWIHCSWSIGTEERQKNSLVDDIFVHCNNTEADDIQETEQLAEVDRDEDDIVELDDTDTVAAAADMNLVESVVDAYFEIELVDAGEVCLTSSCLNC